MTSQGRDELLAGLLDGHLTPAEIEELLNCAVTDPALEHRLLELFRLEPLLIDCALGDEDGASFVRRVQQAMQRDSTTEQFTNAVVQKLGAQNAKRRNSALRIPRSALCVLSAAACVLVALSIVWLWSAFQTQTPPASLASARLEMITGQVSLTDGVLRTSAEPGQQVELGQSIQTGGDDSSAIVVFPDGTRLELDVNTTIRLDADGTQENAAGAGRRVFLVEGVVLASVAKQQVDRPMVLATQQAEVVVRGTRFSLANARDRMHISLESGVVEVKRTSDGKSIQLQTGQYAVVAESEEAFVAQPQPPRLHEPFATLPGHTDQVKALAFTPDNMLLASASDDGFVKLWELGSRSLRDSFGSEPQRCHYVCYSPDGKILAMVASPKQGKRTDTAVQLCDLSTHQQVARFPATLSSLPIVAFSGDSKTLAAVDENRNIQLWDIAAKRLQQTVRMRKGRILALWFSQDGGKLQAVNEYGTLATWELPGGQVLSSQQLQSYEGESECAAISSDGRLFATGAKGAAVQVWEVATAKLRATLHGHGGRILSIAFAPNSEKLGSGSRDQTARLWDLTTAKELATLAIRSYVKTVRFSADGKTLATNGAGGSINLWDVDCGLTAVEVKR